MKLRDALRPLRSVDILALVFGVLVSILDVVLSPRLAEWPSLILLNGAVMAGILMLSRAAARTGSPFVRLMHDFYPIPLIFFSFKEMHVIIQSAGGPDCDAALIAVDRWMFGTDPTVWLQRFASPPLTEVLQLAYAGFYLLMLILGLELYLRKDRESFYYTIFTILYGFFLSYAGYLLVPGVGPRFTLHDFHALNDELPGVLLTNPIRDFINAGESIPKGAADALRLAQRDVFPSGHTEMTLIVMFLASKFRLRSRAFLFVAGTLLIAATVYLRYHYVVDLIAGAAAMVIVVASAPGLHAAWERIKSS